MNDNVKQQSYSKKYNSLHDRTEYFDSGGDVFAYSRKNRLHNRVEFYKANGTFIKSNKY